MLGEFTFRPTQRERSLIEILGGGQRNKTQKRLI